MARVMLVFALLAVPVAAAAQMYKWKDAHGQVHFTQTAPAAGVPFERIGPASPAPAGAAVETSAGAATAPAQDAARQERCRQAIEAVALLDAARSQPNPRLTPEDFKRERDAWQAQSDQNCN
jgi:Domain of unknown function (DUF4124)